MSTFKATFIVFAVLFLGVWKTNAQIFIGHEVGVMSGPAGFFTDYGERWDLKNNLSNEGVGVGIMHFMNFAYRKQCSCTDTEWFFSKHFRIRNEINYLRSRLEHFGPTASKDSEGGRQLRAMHGFSELFQIGSALEYHPFGIRDTRNFSTRFSPYIGIGVHYVNYHPDAYSDLGPLDSPKVLFSTFEDGLNLESGSTFAIVGNGGIRFRIGRSGDVFVDGRAYYYNTDYIEGLDVQGQQNKFNDFVIWFNFGYVYYINF